MTVNNELSICNGINNTKANYAGLLKASFFSLTMGVIMPTSSTYFDDFDLAVAPISNDQYLEIWENLLCSKQRISNQLFDNTGANQVANLFLASNHMETLISKVSSFLDIEDDWDSYGGSAPAKEVVSNTISFLNKIPLVFINQLTEEYLVPTSYGTISIEWGGLGDDFLSVEIGSKEIAFFYEVDAKDGDSDGNIKIDSNTYLGKIFTVLYKIYSPELV
jgi:hypothetical protein